MFKSFLEIQSIGLKDWCWFVICLKRREYLASPQNRKKASEIGDVLDDLHRSLG